MQSPYISPRLTEPPPILEDATTIASPASFSDGAIPSTSYTPPSERYDYVVVDEKAAPRISFSFATRGPVSPPANAKLRSCDVYIGYHGQNANLVRFCRWLKSELELQGIASFVADRAKYADNQSHEIADRIICSVAYGVVVVTPSSFLNRHSVEEVRFFSQKRNLVPLLFDTDRSEIARLFEGRPMRDRDSREAFEGLMKLDEFGLEANSCNWRACVSKAVGILQSNLGRKSVGGEETEDFAELPFPPNKRFVGREKELTEIETAFFGCGDSPEIVCRKPALADGGSNGPSDGFADEESDTVGTGGKYTGKEPTLEASIEPIIELKGRRSLQKHKKARGSIRSHGNASVVCVNGNSGVGKTELALEFAHRYSQRYKMVLWVGGEVRYFRQNILNLSVNLGLDVSAEDESERGRMRSFDEQELDTFRRVRRELFREVPYLLVIDNLETEKEWWEGKGLRDLIPRNTGATHVIVTTRLPKVMSVEPMQLTPLSPADSLLLMRGKRKDYPAEEMEVLRKAGERLGRLSFGLQLIGSLLSELPIAPSALYEAIERIRLDYDDDDRSIMVDDGPACRDNPFLSKALAFCFAVLDRAKGRGGLASRMALAGGWFAPAPVPSGVLAAAAGKLPWRRTSFRRWGECCCLARQARKSEVDSALMVAKLGLARKTTRRPGCWIQLHSIARTFAKWRGGLPPAKAAVQAVCGLGDAGLNPEHLWASAFLVFGFKSEPPLVRLRAADMVAFVKRTALPLAIRSFVSFSRCSSALELLKVCTNVLEEVEKSFVSRVQDRSHHLRPLCWKKKKKNKNKKKKKIVVVDDDEEEYVWRDVTLLKATLLEARAKLLARGGHFDSGEDLCRSCISIRTVVLGHGHAQTVAAQDTLAKLVRLRSKM